jgi:uncharacterized membrane protein YczE
MVNEGAREASSISWIVVIRCFASCLLFQSSQGMISFDILILCLQKRFEMKISVFRAIAGGRDHP